MIMLLAGVKASYLALKYTLIAPSACMAPVHGSIPSFSVCNIVKVGMGLETRLLPQIHVIIKLTVSLGKISKLYCGMHRLEV